MMPEIILNLWYVTDETGAIYSLRAHPYVATGTDDEKLAFLRSRADLDYLIASPFPIPERFHIHVGDGGNTQSSERRIPVTFGSALEVIGGVGALFEDAFRRLKERLPVQTHLTISKSPLICVTPLRPNPDGQVRPHFNGSERL
jgi:hypothetical protein